MKCFVMILTFLLSATLWARDGQILKCLGEEEKRFHLKKETGPVYDLNQRLIAEMIQIPRIELDPDDYLAICAGQKFSESWKLLEHSIKRGKEMFLIPDDVIGMQREMTKGMIDDYVEATREILLTFISQIQTISPTPTCLKEEVPELDKFFTEIKYLQEDVDMKVIFKGRDKTIFEKLRNYPLAFEKCRARLKKKPKSSSTPRAKKS
jgi:hypothetical protein